MQIDYAFFTAAVVKAATDMLIDAVNERRFKDAKKLGKLIHTCRKIDRMLPITKKEQAEYRTFCDYSLYIEK